MIIDSDTGLTTVQMVMSASDEPWNTEGPEWAFSGRIVNCYVIDT